MDNKVQLKVAIFALEIIVTNLSDNTFISFVRVSELVSVIDDVSLTLR